MIDITNPRPIAPHFLNAQKCTLVLRITSAAAAKAYTYAYVQMLRETAMSTTKANSLRVWRQLTHCVLTWQDGSNVEAADLSDSILRDIGLARAERFKPAMPFWLP